DKYGVPRMAFVNKMDRIGANFFRTVQMMRDRLQANPVAVQLPLGTEDAHVGVIDLVTMKAIIWDDDSLGSKYREAEIPEAEKAQAEEYREKLIEAAADADEKVME